MRGRPRKLERKRRTRAEEREANRPPIEVLMRRLEAFGVAVPRGPTTNHPNAISAFNKELDMLVQKLGLAATSTDHPLDVLHVRGDLDDPAAADPKAIGGRRRAAGLNFARLSWRRYGVPFARAVDLGVTSSPTLAERPAGWEMLSREERERLDTVTLRRQEQELGRERREIGIVTRSVCCALQMPTSPSALKFLHRGLDALAAARAPSVGEITEPGACPSPTVRISGSGGG
jgi:hypothetical protein